MILCCVVVETVSSTVVSTERDLTSGLKDNSDGEHGACREKQKQTNKKLPRGAVGCVVCLCVCVLGVLGVYARAFVFPAFIVRRRLLFCWTVCSA